jgi:methionyl-tRNA formyltransferase
MKVFFVGSRCAVFDTLAELDLWPVRVAVVNGSPLQQRLQEDGVDHLALHGKTQLLEAIADTGFDLLVSNGCPWILPVSGLRKPGQTFVNVHPSLLPNLRGKHPLNGAMLFGQAAGVACHLMDDGIDTGAVISRVHVDTAPGVDLGLLYRMAFMAEGDAFRLAHARGFRPGQAEFEHLSGGNMYFSRSPEVMRIRLEDPIELTLRRVAAFSVPGQMARLDCGGISCLVARAERVQSRFLVSRFRHVAAGTLLFKYDDNLVLKLKDGYLRLSGVSGGERLREGMQLTEQVSVSNRSQRNSADEVHP